MTMHLIGGPRSWTLEVDDEGHREYRIVFIAESTSSLDGPAQAIFTPGIPPVGAQWIIDNDRDLYVWRSYGTRVSPMTGDDGEPTSHWLIECKFTNKPLGRDRQRCNDFRIEDPLLEPQRVSGGYTKYTEEAASDRFGRPVYNSCLEQLSGPQIEFDKNRPTVRIEQNVAALGANVWGPMIDTVNDRPLWGFARRCIKLSNVSWERKFYGACYKYYTRTFDFDIRADTFDRNLIDQGTKVLKGHWHPTDGTWVLEDINGKAPNPSNPAHFIRAKDRNDENINIILDGHGKPYIPDPPIIEPSPCASCDNYIPATWSVGGFPNVTVPGVLNHSSGCTWTGSITVAGQPYTLTLTHESSIVGYGLPGWNLEMPPNQSGQGVANYFAFDTGWDCSGFNLLLLNPNDVHLNPLTETVSLTPGGTNSPGRILLQKYGESNFLALGIPLVL